jgi:hypothetical protein
LEGILGTLSLHIAEKALTNNSPGPMILRAPGELIMVDPLDYIKNSTISTL